MGFLCEKHRQDAATNAPLSKHLWLEAMVDGSRALTAHALQQAGNRFGAAHEIATIQVDHPRLFRADIAAKRLTTACAGLTLALTRQDRPADAQVYLGELHEKLLNLCVSPCSDMSTRLTAREMISFSLPRLCAAFKQMHKEQLAFELIQYTRQALSSAFPDEGWTRSGDECSQSAHC